MTSFCRQNKIKLEDYDYQKDIRDRILLSHFSSEEVEILEEIVCGPPAVSLGILSGQLDKSPRALAVILEKLLETNLFSIDGDTLIVNKERRRYFETQIVKFKENFSPGIEFLQALLKKVPFHILINWYQIPRTSDNIVHSVIEKYLHTPQIFLRYVTDLDLGDEKLSGIVRDLFAAPDYKIYSAVLRKKYGMDEEEFERNIIHLEFHLLCCLTYEKRGDRWVEVVSLFKEWRDYLSFLKRTQPKEIKQTSRVKRTRPSDFAFVEDISEVLRLSDVRPLCVYLNENEEWVFDKQTAIHLCKYLKGFDLNSQEGQEVFVEYSKKIIQKLLLLKCVYIEQRQLVFAKNEAEEWLSLPTETRAFNIYKQTVHVQTNNFFANTCTQRNIHEIEKELGRIMNLGWVFLKDFLSGIIAPISDNSKMYLRKEGRSWRYTLPNYSEEEVALLKKVIYEWLFESGVIATGLCEGEECLKITAFGRSMFG